jgi:hypothetical protein
MKKLALLAAALLCAAAFAAPAYADSSSHWKAYSLAPSGQTLSSRVADNSSALASFDFLAQPATTSYLMTNWPGYSRGSGAILGDLTGKTITATYGIAGTNPAFWYSTANGNTCGTPPTVRLFLQGDTTGKFDPAHYWWSNPVSAQLALGGGTLSETLADPSRWSDFYGQFGGDPAAAAGFADAVSHVDSIGVSFGGGCFFANGVGVSSGSATFNLTGYTATP